MIPHTPLLILFTTSAQTHIFPEIRIDAIRFIDLFLEVIPETLVSGWTEGSGHGNRVLDGYLGILNAGTKFSEAEGEKPLDFFLLWMSLTTLFRSNASDLDSQCGPFCRCALFILLLIGCNFIDHAISQNSSSLNPYPHSLHMHYRHPIALLQILLSIPPIFFYRLGISHHHSQA